MKKIFFVILFISLFNSKNLSFAQESPMDLMEVSPTASPTPTVINKYTLPYPGILPNNPLYKLKVLRDKISMYLISDPLKKINFYLLQADKGMNATKQLISSNNKKLAEETALKAEHNITLINTQLTRLSSKPDEKLFLTLIDASHKHQEILMDIIKNQKKDDSKTFSTVLEISKYNLEKIEKYHLKNPKTWNNKDI